MRVLFLGDSPTVNTGFSRCTRVACEALISHGHDVTVLGMAYYGDPHSYSYAIWPCYAPFDNAKSYGGEARLPSMIMRIKPDVIVILQDPWNLKPYFDCIDSVARECKDNDIEFVAPPIVGWLAVDSKNQKGEQLERLSHVMVWTEFACKEFKSVGYEGSCDIVPLGVDTDLFYPRDKKESRIELGFDQLGIPLDAFIVGVVGRNQTRKRLELTLDYFSAWLHRYNVEDAYLYLHVAPTGEASCDLKSLVRFFDLRGKVIVHTPDAGVGDDDARMPFVYSAMDVYMTQSQAEGFGLPALEAMACGVECVLPNHSAFGKDGGWVRENCAYHVPCSGVALTAPQGRNPYTVGAIADKEATIDTLSWIYQHRHILTPNQDALNLASELTWKNTGAAFVESLERFMIGYSESTKANEVQQVIDFNRLELELSVANG
jgi:D-inositol-3-phosphate glycosyltransferase